MKKRRWLGGLWPAVLVLALVLGSGSIPASASDFNRDGFDDLAIGVEWEDVGTVENAGAVNVLYGSGGGISAAGDQLWYQDVLGGTDSSEEHDYFGYRLAAGDLNGDGAADLAVGMSGENIGTAVDGGAVHILYGVDAAGLVVTGNQFWHQGSPEVKGSVESGDRFGAALAVGDFDGDGYDDLAVGAPDEAIGAEASAGAVNVFYGTSGGLTAGGDHDDQMWYEGDEGGITGVAEAGDWLGYALAAGDFDNDGRDDLAIGIAGEDLGGVSGAGRVVVLYGTSAGLSNADSQAWVQGLSGIGNAYEEYDYFGKTLATGDFDGDGYDDLAVGVPNENWVTTSNTGAVNVIYGSADGLTDAGNQVWTDGGYEEGDEFGRALAAGDFDGDGDDELAIGIPYEDLGSIVNAGAVDILCGASGGLFRRSDPWNDFWHQDRSGTQNSAEEGDLFGIALAAGNFDGDDYIDLAVGIRNEDIGTIIDAGAAHVFYGSADGITATGDTFWHQDIEYVEGGAETNDHFGNALAAFPASRYQIYLPLVLHNH